MYEFPVGDEIEAFEEVRHAGTAYLVTQGEFTADGPVCRHRINHLNQFPRFLPCFYYFELLNRAHFLPFDDGR